MSRKSSSRTFPRLLVRGMYLVGGGGLLRGLAARIERETRGSGADVERSS